MSPVAFLSSLSDAADVSDAVLGGTFTVEAALKLDRNATGDNQYAAYSIGSGSYTAPRTLCFDMRLSNGKRGCIQYNANAWKSSGVNFLNAYAGNSSTIAATYALAGGGSAGSDALAYHDGDYLQTIQNYGDYTTSSSIDKKLRVRHYGSGIGTTSETMLWREDGRHIHSLFHKQIQHVPMVFSHKSRLVAEERHALSVHQR